MCMSITTAILYLTKMPKTYTGGKATSSTNGAGKSTYPDIQKWKLDPYLSLFTKINFKWIEDHKEKPKMLNLLKENISSNI